MTQLNEFSSGTELASYVTSSGVLSRSWNTISSSTIPSNKGQRLSWKVHSEEDSDFIIIVFEAKSSQVKTDLVSSLELKKQNKLHFEFLCTRKSPEFQVNKDACHLFYENLQRLDDLKSHITSSTRLIVTGQGLGGSVAILFTLSLLDRTLTGKNRPLCITFGLPLIGDTNLQKAMSRSTTWNSCFLQVVSHKDPLLRPFDPQATHYMPFGTFLFCSDESSTCFENPESILKILKVLASIQGNQGFQSADYGNIVEKLYRKSIYKDVLPRGVDMNGYSTLQASISLQLSALGLTPQVQQQQHNIDIDNLVSTMETLEKKFNYQKRATFDPTKKLNSEKVNMVQLEWFKKDSRNKNIGYYDRYKNMLSTNMFSTSELDVINYRKNLTNYWEKMVEAAELKPQKEGAQFRTRWLFAGTNYRRMVEPLEIANYYYSNEEYKKFGKSYLENRPKHYKQLEEWLKEGIGAAAAASNSTSISTKNVESILNFDSCFWAHVEEALISCKVVKDVKANVLKKEEEKKKLHDFEDYVYGLLKNSEVSSDIFLRDSSYMTWWNEYEKIDGAVSHSKLGRFMSNADNYNVKYVKGTYNFN
ncbi:hypothetical protein PIB30_076591 [Stylosanthes scabra]|uniref:Senescence-associated carboxylesterase 101 n=1 Tax=Stylosanthes scabra TaxID=79078 RepID=A0ABU6ZNZ5_9FABA|nr:hypothetical protein [Stylosanthes scabra]